MKVFVELKEFYGDKRTYYVNINNIAYFAPYKENEISARMSSMLYSLDNAPAQANTTVFISAGKNEEAVSIDIEPTIEEFAKMIEAAQ